ncbi:MAG: hypothetical protein M3437_09360 [Chloroflexota bacterium]|nr:hypothetical protein [Chloroflexota bacterium]MDQ5866509.1 hypothetical protein [Chloroflexota bacterium]
MLTLERPASKELAQFKRSEKYKVLKENSSKLREAIVNWIEEHDLAGEVHDVGYPSAFNILFVTGTPKAAEALRNAPGVESVGVSPDFKVDLLQRPGKSDPY